MKIAFLHTRALFCCIAATFGLQSCYIANPLVRPPTAHNASLGNIPETSLPMAEHINKIGAPGIWPRFRGQGQVIAVIDSGINLKHPMLASQLYEQDGKIIQACFSGTAGRDDQGTYQSICDNGQTVSYSSQAAQMCDVGKISALSFIGDVLFNGAKQLKNTGICNHGSHVTGIIAGRTSTFGKGENRKRLSGIAPEAKVIPIKIISKYIRNNGSWYYATHARDMIKALEFVLTQKRSGVPIAVVNMSVGNYLNEREIFLDGAKPVGYDSACDQTNEENQQISSLIEQLKKLGVLVVAATGNAGLPRQSVTPSCISGVIRVANSTSQDQYRSSDHIPHLPYIFAPGTDIYSATTYQTNHQQIESYTSFSGASQSAAVVSGGIALIKQAFPMVSAEQIESALRTPTDVQIRGNGIIAPRFNIPYAFQALKSMGLKESQ